MRLKTVKSLIGSSLLVAPLLAANAMPKVELSGVIQSEASWTNAYKGTANSSDIQLDLATLEVKSMVSKNLEGAVAMIYEEDDADSLALDYGYLKYQVTPNVHLKAGTYYMPFGQYKTSLPGDPLVLHLSEQIESAVELGFKFNALTLQGYTFNGTSHKPKEGDSLKHYGARLAYEHKTNGLTVEAAASWTNSAHNLDFFSGRVTSNNKDVAATSLALNVNGANFSLVSEYVFMDQFDKQDLVFKTKGAKPAAYQVELGYKVAGLMGKQSTLLFRYEGTKESKGLNLPENVVMGGVAVQLEEKLTFTLSYEKWEDYGKSDGGTGEDASITTAQLRLNY